MSRTSVALALLSAVACDKPKVDAPSPAASAQQPAVVRDAAVVASAEKAATCTFGETAIEYDCAELVAFKKSIESVDPAKGNPTFVSLVEEKDEKLRWLGVYALSYAGKGHGDDAALVGRLAAAAGKETSKLVARDLGELVGRAGSGEAVAKAHALVAMRVGAVTGMIYGGRAKDVEAAVAFAKDPEPDVRRAVVDALLTVPKELNEKACAAWLVAMKDEKETVAAAATHKLTITRKGGDCQRDFDAVLSNVEARARAGALDHGLWGQTLDEMYARASDAQKKKALEVARLIASNTTHATGARNSALRAVWRHDPGAKPFLAKLQNDKDSYVAIEAANLAKEPPPKDD